MRSFTVFLSGLIFAVGLVLAGMTQPSKVVGFLDFFGNWDPSLAFVMGGAMLVHIGGYWWVKKRTAPILANYFSIPTRTDIDGRLVLGAALFGTGWGLGGYCPGPAITSLSTVSSSAFIFAASMITGMLLFRVVDTWLAKNKAKKAEDSTPEPEQEASSVQFQNDYEVSGG